MENLFSKIVMTQIQSGYSCIFKVDTIYLVVLTGKYVTFSHADWMWMLRASYKKRQRTSMSLFIISQRLQYVIQNSIKGVKTVSVLNTVQCSTYSLHTITSDWYLCVLQHNAFDPDKQA